ncbi:hypothetical protein J6590_030728 [Homalodisca vitripennis]|nr:hypothetical protein J6590_030728 [Homalodisca vitripennis]
MPPPVENANVPVMSPLNISSKIRKGRQEVTGVPPTGKVILHGKLDYLPAILLQYVEI